MNLKLNPYSKVENTPIDGFRLDVLEGLKSNPKRLSSKYFYDKNGDRLFQEIMAMPEYYLTKCELDIFQNKTPELAQLIISDNEPFDLIELGAGDAMKSTFLLQYLVEQGINFTYMPIDISGNILSILNEKLSHEIPDLPIVALEGEYFQMLQKAAALSHRRKVILFLGSNIGNMDIGEADQFCSDLNQNLTSGDKVLIGFDLKKNPHTILNAYNDKAGITAAFNLNLLTRINTELDADFDTDQFQHYQTYDPVSGACKSYLVSLKDQKVTIDDHSISFKENELIDMEISQKFSPEKIEELRKKSGFLSAGEIKDSKRWFVDVAWEVK
ncbi:L-histidine N(alpha)-methyltransferase [Chryseobacterium carnipullorum]|uniref:Histidine-specific methyltransferase EgtD n=1 Tax=Chryseobacterium carnipullorum TaxID=1124835 RepID=A0A376DR19_CHRCU|nr:L-histidine N(alpha)-methyltransferase [Chryseobacterium carnipullorum]AZA49241.1 L-histidine N(alpha)-methyltransferase [Chryseobacterium carnipullorum]AZA64135.1 L-histidine N(alpha)-methyltransferase [Chryseobacterium carnipullorum]STC94057.1 Histidine-specific methyltransferase EgtD [Chryseobacterium carnipullorum]